MIFLILLGCLYSSGTRYLLKKINTTYLRFIFHLTPITRCCNPLSSMHWANLTLIVPLILLAATVAISVTVSEDAFARERYSGDSTSQAAAVSNDCLNPIFDSSNIDNAVGVGNCGGTISQQDESGQAGATTTHQTANPTIELQRSTTSQPPLTANTCEGCFNILSATQQAAIEEILAGNNSPLLQDEIWGVNPPTTIEELCKMWATFNTAQRGTAGGDIVQLVGDIHVSESTITAILRCLDGSVG
jgi:hypothetical protein